MRIFLRVVAVYTFFTVLFTINLLTHIWQRGGFPLLLKSGVFGIATFIGWAVTIFAGVPAAVLLWRLRNSGRIATAIVLGSIGLYYLLGLVFFRKPQSSTGELLFGIVFSGALVWGILSPAAARACRSERSEPRKSDEMGTEFPRRKD
jgi:hypothetical protein